MRVLRIIDGTTVDGPGFRTSIYFAGCSHHCHGCHNPQSWDPEGGEEMSIDAIMARIAENDMDVTFTGGDPIYQIEQLTILAQRIKTEQKRNIWCYTGYTFEQLLQMPQASELLPWIDVMVDSPFILERRNTDLLFRGSDNQRLVDVVRSLSAGKIVQWQSGF